MPAKISMPAEVTYKPFFSVITGSELSPGFQKFFYPTFNTTYKDGTTIHLNCADRLYPEYLDGSGAQKIFPNGDKITITTHYVGDESKLFAVSKKQADKMATGNYFLLNKEGTRLTRLKPGTKCMNEFINYVEKLTGKQFRELPETSISQKSLNKYFDIIRKIFNGKVKL